MSHQQEGKSDGFFEGYKLMLPFKPPLAQEQESSPAVFIHEMLEQGHSFTTAQIKLENWEYINDYDDSDGAMEISSNDRFSLCSEESQQQSQSNKKFESARNTLRKQGNFQVKIQENQVAYLESKEYKGNKRRKRVRKDKREKEGKVNSLKNISFSVCDFVENFSSVKFPELMNKFIEANPQYAKNLRRRMYDVINVLASANIIQKKGLILKRIEKRATIFDEKSKSQTENKKCQKLEDYKKQIHDTSLRILEKRKLLQQLKKRRENLSLISDKIPFPVAMYTPSKETISMIQRNEPFVYNSKKQTIKVCHNHSDIYAMITSSLRSMVKIEENQYERNNERTVEKGSKQFPIILISKGQ